MAGYKEETEERIACLEKLVENLTKTRVHGDGVSYYRNASKDSPGTACFGSGGSAEGCTCWTAHQDDEEICFDANGGVVPIGDEWVSPPKTKLPVPTATGCYWIYWNREDEEIAITDTPAAAGAPPTVEAPNHPLLKITVEPPASSGTANIVRVERVHCTCAVPPLGEGVECKVDEDAECLEGVLGVQSGENGCEEKSIIAPTEACQQLVSRIKRNAAGNPVLDLFNKPVLEICFAEACCCWIPRLTPSGQLEIPGGIAFINGNWTEVGTVTLPAPTSGDFVIVWNYATNAVEITTDPLETLDDSVCPLVVGNMSGANPNVMTYSRKHCSCKIGPKPPDTITDLCCPLPPCVEEELVSFSETGTGTASSQALFTEAGTYALSNSSECAVRYHVCLVGRSTQLHIGSNSADSVVVVRVNPVFIIRLGKDGDTPKACSQAPFVNVPLSTSAGVAQSRWTFCERVCICCDLPPGQSQVLSWSVLARLFGGSGSSGGSSPTTSVSGSLSIEVTPVPLNAPRKV